MGKKIYYLNMCFAENHRQNKFWDNIIKSPFDYFPSHAFNLIVATVIRQSRVNFHAILRLCFAATRHPLCLLFFMSPRFSPRFATCVMNILFCTNKLTTGASLPLPVEKYLAEKKWKRICNREIENIWRVQKTCSTLSSFQRLLAVPFVCI